MILSTTFNNTLASPLTGRANGRDTRSNADANDQPRVAPTLEEKNFSGEARQTPTDPRRVETTQATDRPSDTRPRSPQNPLQTDDIRQAQLVIFDQASPGATTAYLDVQRTPTNVEPEQNIIDIFV